MASVAVPMPVGGRERYKGTPRMDAAAVDQTKPPRPGVRGRAAQVAAILGMVVCAAVIVGAWLVYFRLAGGVDDLSAGVDSGLDRGNAAVATVTGRIEGAATQAGELAQRADEAAAN